MRIQVSMHRNFKHLTGRIIDKIVVPFTPKSWRLTLQYQKHVLFFGWEPEVRKIKDFARTAPLAVDVGANIGLWTYAMVKSGLFEHVVALEPNWTLTDDLQKSRLPHLTVLHKAASGAPGTSHLRIPKQGRALLSGWASLEPQSDSGVEEFEEILVQTVRLDDLELSAVGFIKIDVEGHELSVLHGARELFRTSQPVCLIECRPRNRQQVEDYFAGLSVGYKRVDTKARYGFDLAPNNFLFDAR